MATNGILDIGIQETVEDFRDPDLELSPEETMDIIKTLQVVGVDQEKYGEFTEEFKIWKQSVTTSRWAKAWIQDVEVRALWKKP